MVQKNATDKKESILRTLIVDDDPEALTALAKILSPYGKTDTAEESVTAVNAYRQSVDNGEPYDVVFLDMADDNEVHAILEQIRGIEADKGIHALDGVKIIMTAAPDNNRGSEKTFKSGCEGYLKKPIDQKQLIKMLKTLNFDKKIFNNKL